MEEPDQRHYGGTRPAASQVGAPRAAMPPRRQAWLRVFVVRYGLPCDPPVGGHSCNGGMIPRFHRCTAGFQARLCPLWVLVAQKRFDTGEDRTRTGRTRSNTAMLA